MQHVDNSKHCIKNCGECTNLVLPEVGDRMRDTGFMNCTHMSKWHYLPPSRPPLKGDCSCPYAEAKKDGDGLIARQPADYDLFGESVSA